MRFTTPHGYHFFHHGIFAEQAYDETGLHRGWLAAMGIVFAVLGVIGLGYLTVMTLMSVLFFGGLCIVAGFSQLVQSFSAHGLRNVLPAALLGVLYLFAGAIIYLTPVASSVELTFFLAATLIALGFVRMAFSIEHRTNRYWGWSIASGALSVILGFLIMAQWPVTGLWVIGLFVSLELISHGVTAVVMSLEPKGFGL
ncbi:HdeD family acid-resistance protein [Geomesophilobacter sediminis]|uniref:HdeD family acid-resistance protein n=1 Tax=Geomesophilobacter sediminis TaxID=2798584 RepID=A0A8J7SAQ8_9BACT|nr:HdeD family acid-resistance protein [Geomesophilobacter sediminis]MBJ6727416.1 HdeD family acid-resistance protein [Geomesophilobacter sediminis]